MKIDVTPFLEDYFLANTPAYLLRKTLENAHLDGSLAPFQDGELVELIDAADKANASSAECVTAYVALIGLMKRNAVSLLNSLRLRTPAYLRWLPSLIAEWDDTRRADTNVELPFKKAITLAKMVSEPVGGEIETLPS
jgi:hypothetical protein